MASQLSDATKILDYVYPASLFFLFVAIFVFDWLTLRTANTGKKGNRGHKTALVLTLIVFSTYAGQVLVNLVHALRNRGWDVPEHRIVGTLGDTFVWGVLSGALISIESPCWDPFVGSWIAGLAFESVIFGLAAPSVGKRNPYDLIRVILQGVRIGALVVTMFNVFRLKPSEKQTATADEAAPLLAETNENGSAVNGYGSVKAADEDEEPAEEVDPDKELKELQRKRLESHGGWWGYIKEFTIFIPYLVPYKNRKVQLCIVFIMINMVLDRFVNVMVPRQIGIITDELANDYRILPWKAVLFWVFLRWLNSFASFGLISDIAHTYLHNWSSAQIKGLAFRHVMSLSQDFHSNKDSGDVIKSISQADSLNDMLETLFFELLPIFLDVFIAFFYITHLFDGAMAMVILMVGFMFVWTSISTTARTRPKRRVYTEKSRAESKTLYECVSNWPTISYFNRIPYEEERYEQKVKEEMDAQLRYYISSSLGYAVQYLIIYAGLITVAMMAIFQISEGRKPIGNFVTLVMYWSTMMSPLHMITYQYRRISGATVDAERLLGLLQTLPSIRNKVDAKPLVAEKGKVIFSNVGFSYDDRKPTLKGLDFTVEPGQTLALVGETGGGKSSTLKLLFRFYDVKEGSITIDGQDIRDVTVESLRQELGVVPQDPSLFNQTIMENVRYARLEATDEEVIDACKAAAVHEKIVTFPDKYKSKVGERGVKLSGGELQRIAIARVILKNPKIVLLDEATSAVDSAIEAQIQAAFKKLSAGRTTFVVAHRLSTIMEADLILVIDHGEIIERGTHEELIQHGKKYFELWTKQTSGNKSKDGSKANSFLDVPNDIHCAVQNDLTPATYSAEIKKAFIEDDNETTLFQVDGACESKVDGEDAGCFGLSGKKKSKTTPCEGRGEGSASSSDHDGDGPIRMVSAKPTTSTVSPMPEGAIPRTDTFGAIPEEDDSTAPDQQRPRMNRLDTEAQPSSTMVEPQSESSSFASPKVPRFVFEDTTDPISTTGSEAEGPKPVKKSVRGRKPTGYPTDMPRSLTSDSDVALRTPKESDDTSEGYSPSTKSARQANLLSDEIARNEAKAEAKLFAPTSTHTSANSLALKEEAESANYFSSTRGTRRPTQISEEIARDEAEAKVKAQASVQDDDDDDDIRGVDRFDTASE